MRYRGGDTKPLVFKTDPLHPIEEGDLVFQHPANGCVWPATDMANQATAALNQDAFQQYFAGVALQKVGLQPGEKTFKLTDDPGYVVVATAGDFEFDCDATQWTQGELVGVWADGTGCQSQKVATAASASLAIGLANLNVPALSNSMTRVTVAIDSTITGGVQNQVAGSGSGQ